MGVSVVGSGFLVIFGSVLGVDLVLGFLGGTSGEMIMSHFTSSSTFYFGVEFHRYLIVSASLYLMSDRLRFFIVSFEKPS